MATCVFGGPQKRQASRGIGGEQRENGWTQGLSAQKKRQPARKKGGAYP